MTARAGHFDFGTYQRIPTVTLEAGLALARALRTMRPSVSSDSVTRAADQLAEVIAEAERVVAEPLPACPPELDADASELAEGSDALWETLRERLSAWQGFEHPDLDGLIEDGRSGLADSLRAGREKAERARRCLEQVFGSGGLRFLRLPERDRVAATAAVLRGARQEGLIDDIAELAGPELFPALEGCQREFEEQVRLRLVTEVERLPRAEQLRSELHQVTVAYVIAVLGLVRLREPESFARVHAALRPLIVLRTQISEGRWLAGAEEARLEDDLFAEEGVDDGALDERAAG